MLSYSPMRFSALPAGKTSRSHKRKVKSPHPSLKGYGRLARYGRFGLFADADDGCDTGYTGSNCDECSSGYVTDDTGDNCVPAGSTTASTGSSSCDTGYTGSNCDECAAGYALDSTGDNCVASADSSGGATVASGSSGGSSSSSSVWNTLGSSVGSGLKSLFGINTGGVKAPTSSGSSILLPLLFVGGAIGVAIFLTKSSKKNAPTPGA